MHTDLVADPEAKQYMDMPDVDELRATGWLDTAVAWFEACGLNVKQIPADVSFKITHEGRLKFRGYALKPNGETYGHSCCNPREFHIVMTDVVAPKIAPVPEAFRFLVMRYGTREPAFPKDDDAGAGA